MRAAKTEDAALVDTIAARLKASKKTLAVGHVNADPDAIGAAIALSEAFPHVTVGAFEGLNKSAQRLVDALGVKVVINPRVEDYDTVVVCDATSASQLNCKDPQQFASAIFMDHHQPSNFAGTPYYWSDARYKATCEMALYLSRRAGAHITERAQVAILAGLITDTGRFKYNDEAVFSSVFELFFGPHGAPLRPGLYQFARALMEESERDASEVTAQLKGMQRVQFERVGEWFVAWTVVSSFESNCSVLLLGAGADVAVAFSEHGRRVRGSSRATRAAAEVGVNLGGLYRDFKPHAAGVQWDGGGHAAAAGFTAERGSAGPSEAATGTGLSPWADAVRKQVIAAIAACLEGKTPKSSALPPPWDAGNPPSTMGGGMV
jgi:bifunctional oligoribonuclease and PAP phosphatase NrnA